MNVLIDCEESQRVCIEFRRLGHRAFSADIQEPSGGHPEWHICGDVIPLINGNCEFTTTDGTKHKQDGKWDMLIAFPPCTYLSNAGACRLYPHKGQIDKERYAKGLKGKEFFLHFLSADCKKIAVENPRPLSIYELPLPTQKIQPYQFDSDGKHPYTKLTYLWLKGLPELIPTTPSNEPIDTWISSNTSKNKGKQNGAAPNSERQKNRSKTFIGVAKAMAQQWGDGIIKTKEPYQIHFDGYV